METRVSAKGKTALSAMVKSPILACVRNISRNEVIIVALEDLMARPL